MSAVSKSHKCTFLAPLPKGSNEYLFAAGWGEPYPQQKESSSWGEPTAGPPVTVDNGTSAWGKPKDSTAGWDETSRESRDSGWGTQNKPGRWTQGYVL